MCLKNLPELVQAASAAQKAVEDLKAFEDSRSVDYAFTSAEVLRILKARVEASEAALRALGYVPPPTRVNEGDAISDMRARGMTPPGELPASRTPEDARDPE